MGQLMSRFWFMLFPQRNTRSLLSDWIMQAKQQHCVGSRWARQTPDIMGHVLPWDPRRDYGDRQHRPGSNFHHERRTFPAAPERRSSKAVLLVFANKQDLKDAMSPAEITDALSLHSIKNHDWHIQACSALTAMGSTMGWVGLLRELREKQQARENR
ncbi:hypothetical protein OSB04_029632 [Centaurea solstitialis]|uniref:Uncharacterized protein n=1 Tax=Centaurea solstitialis TaxID=347529 RepID=A0AA38W461_9ASTR|nr:hypothetical protein OSB04_029632 [Centaurea solstitialis]